ncbi:ClbS/DfsB family four-helix bundle protein [Ekhidna sp.]
MPRPTSKVELISLSNENHQKLINYIDQLSSDQQTAEFPKGTLNRNISDVLAHLHEWNTMTLGWYEVGMTGEKPDMPAQGYSWKDLPDLNKKIWEKYQSITISKAKEMFNDSFKKLQEVIEKHTDEELFEKKKYKWTGTTSLGSYLISATSSHNVWALKLIKKATKS